MKTPATTASAECAAVPWSRHGPNLPLPKSPGNQTPPIPRRLTRAGCSTWARPLTRLVTWIIFSRTTKNTNRIRDWFSWPSSHWHWS